MSDVGDIYEAQVAKAIFHDRHPARKYTHWPYRVAQVARRIKRLTGHSGKILDIGCSNGLALAAMGEGWEKNGVELCPATAEIARQFAGAQVFCGAIENYSAPENYFDVVTAFAVIEHVSDPVWLIQWAVSHLKTNGLLVIMTGDRESRIAQTMQDRWPLLLSPDHVSYFSARSLTHLLQSSGLEVVHQEWRYVYSAIPENGLCRTWKKVQDLFGFNQSPVYDHYYCYAVKKTTDNIDRTQA